MAITGDLTIEELVPELATQISQINLWIKGLGIFTALWVVYVTVLFVLERKRMKRLEVIEQKIDRLLKKRK
ncbi:hypothetical protein HYT25_00550 [Candidatus Pacearchaeota archaeon]|nr:hypothetical protein [Candidatus Pacearchaeota archaeon]